MIVWLIGSPLALEMVPTIQLGDRASRGVTPSFAWRLPLSLPIPQSPPTVDHLHDVRRKLLRKTPRLPGLRECPPHVSTRPIRESRGVFPIVSENASSSDSGCTPSPGNSEMRHPRTESYRVKSSHRPVQPVHTAGFDAGYRDCSSPGRETQQHPGIHGCPYVHNPLSASPA